MAIFSNFFVNINTHIIRCNAGERIDTKISQMKAVLISSRFDISNKINLQPMRGRLGGWMVGARLGGDMSGVSVSGMFDLDQGVSVLRERKGKIWAFWAENSLRI